MRRYSSYLAVSGFFIVVLLVHGFLGASCDSVNQRTIQAKTRKALEEFYKKYDRDWGVLLSPEEDRVISLVGSRSQPYPGEPLEKATQFLKENAGLFGLQPGLEDLRLLTARVTDFSINVEFQQVFKELPVENGRIQINFDKEGRVVQVFNSYTPTPGALESVKLTKEQATKTAVKEFLRIVAVHLSKGDKQEKSDYVLVLPSEGQLPQLTNVADVYFASQGSLRRAYKTLVNAEQPFGAKEFVTDANSGEVLQTRDFVYGSADGRGQVFLPNPVNSLNNNTIRDDFLTYNNPNPYYFVTLRGLDAPPGGPFTLKGPYVVLEDIQDPAIAPPTEASADRFVYERNSDKFEAVMVYFHIDRMQRYIQSLGFSSVMNRPIRADAHGCYGYDNSEYVSTPATLGQGYVAFGDGGIDDAEDADIIAHEYGHAIQDNQKPGAFSVVGQAKAMGEGFGDYWAFSSNIDAAIASGHDKACIGEWDKVPNCLRSVNLLVTTDNYGAGNSPQENGTIWSMTLFRIFSKLDKNTADRLILQSHFNVPDNPNFVQGAEAIIAADQQLFSRSHVPVLCTVFRARGINRVAGCPAN